MTLVCEPHIYFNIECQLHSILKLIGGSFDNDICTNCNSHEVCTKMQVGKAGACEVL